MKYGISYISCNSNQTPTIADWGQNNTVCYGSCNTVLIYDVAFGSGGKVTHTLVGHSKRVNSVRWLKGQNVHHETEVISGSTDSTVRVWSLRNGAYESAVLIGHESNVNIVDGLYKEDNQQAAVVVSVSMDCTVKIWLRLKPGDDFQSNQTINLGYNISTGVRLTFLPNSDELVLACALDNSKIQLYSQTSKDCIQFELSTQLSGHEDWVRGLDFTTDGEDLLLASSSQDAFIRLWRISPKETRSEGLTLKKNELKTYAQIYLVLLESVLTGHEGWVYSVNWSPKTQQLLSASIDKSMIIWEHDVGSGLWLEKIRVGEVGGNTLGFYGGVFGPDGEKILAHSYHGAFHIWEYSEDIDSWLPCVTVGGHFSEVVDCAWEPEGEFLYSCSADQTTRIHGPWKDGDKEITWHEIARPQVHGYDMNTMAVISRYKFASGADEKVIRTFQAPANFIENFQRICCVEIDAQGENIIETNSVGPKGASVPSLGLSNKAVYTDDNIEQATALDKKNPYPEESHFVATDLFEPPTEETLLQNTLWPEMQKLYGHGYEVYSLAASPDGKFLASACKSTKPEHSVVLLWDTSKWQQVQKLMSHTLTVVQLQFSPDSLHLLSVSRDRRWSLFSKSGESEFELVATVDKSTSVHSRIIWTCSWSHDSKYFATGSRDGKVVVWTINKQKVKTNVLGQCEVAGEPLAFKNESVTAVAFGHSLVADKYLMAIGFESGIIKIFQWSTRELEEVLSLSQSDAHHLTVKRLAFRPSFGRAGHKIVEENIVQLASCSSDQSVKIHDIFLD